MAAADGLIKVRAPAPGIARCRARFTAARRTGAPVRLGAIDLTQPVEPALCSGAFERTTTLVRVTTRSVVSAC
jgi:hypothetical protein